MEYSRVKPLVTSQRRRLVVLESHDAPVEFSAPEEAVSQLFVASFRTQPAAARHFSSKHTGSESGMDHGHGAADTRFVGEVDVKPTAEIAFGPGAGLLFGEHLGVGENDIA